MDPVPLLFYLLRAKRAKDLPIISWYLVNLSTTGFYYCPLFVPIPSLFIHASHQKLLPARQIECYYEGTVIMMAALTISVCFPGLTGHLFV
jgi:hypothetical protein